MDRYRGRGCVCFVHCSDQAGGKLSVRVFTSDQTALTNPSSKKHLVRSHKVWNVFEALLQPLSLSLFLCMLSMSLAPVNGQPLSAKHTEKKEKSSWPPKRFTVSVFVVVFVSVALPRDDNTIPVWLAQRERERGWLCIRLEIEIWDMKIVTWDECFVSSLYSIQLHHRTVVFMSWDVNLWASLQPRHQHELKRSTRVKVNMVLKYYCGKIIWVKVE